jgi:hypothetical protein
MRAPVGGGAPTVLATGQAAPGRLALDATHVFWVNAWGLNEGSVMRADLDGSNVTTVAANQNAPIALAVGGNVVCWCSESPGLLACANIDGTNPQTIATNRVWDGGFVYFVDSSTGDLSRALVTGSAATRFQTGGPVGYSGPVAVDVSNIYFSVGSNPGFARVSKLGGATAPLLPKVNGYYGTTTRIVLDDTHYYFIGVAGSSNVSIMRNPK